MSLPAMDFTDAARKKVQTFADGSKREYPVTDAAYDFPPGVMALTVTGRDGRIVFASPAMCELSGYETDELIGQPHHILRHPDVPDAVYQALWDKLGKSGHWQGVLKNMRRDGRPFWTHIQIVADDSDEMHYYALHRCASPSEQVDAGKLYRALSAEESGA